MHDAQKIHPLKRAYYPFFVRTHEGRKYMTTALWDTETKIWTLNEEEWPLDKDIASYTWIEFLDDEDK